MKSLLLTLALLGLTLAPVGCGGASEAATTPGSSKSETKKTPLIQKATLADWCTEHAVPESVCTRCNEELEPQFQAKGDWCQEHALPESQCLDCHPDLKAKFDAMAPKSGK
jgi:cobalt-zinc-cadmium efflux system membrane fusion protein